MVPSSGAAPSPRFFLERVDDRPGARVLVKLIKRAQRTVSECARNDGEKA